MPKFAKAVANPGKRTTNEYIPLAFTPNPRVRNIDVSKPRTRVNPWRVKLYTVSQKNFFNPSFSLMSLLLESLHFRLKCPKMYFLVNFFPSISKAISANHLIVTISS